MLSPTLVFRNEYRSSARSFCCGESVVQVFGCRHDEAIHAVRRPASEKRQGTKSREVGHRRCRGRLWRFSRGTLILVPGNFSKGVLASKACTTLALWHKDCSMGKVGFSPHVISKS